MVTYTTLAHTRGFVSTHNFRQRNKLASSGLLHGYNLHNYKWSSYKLQLLKLIRGVLNAPMKAGHYFRQEMYF